MRDAAELAADVVLPAPDGRFPTILVRTPYGRAAAMSAWGADALVRRGYAVVAQDVRGKGDSDGTFDLPWVGEGPDGYDTIEWIASQPWSDGSVGTLGGSYLGQVQWAAAVLRPPALKAMLVFPSISDPFFGGAYDCGVFSLTPFWAWENEGRRPRDVPEFEEEAFLALPLTRVDDAMFGESAALWDRYLALDRQDSWDACHWPEDLSRVAVPVLHLMALWDGDGIGPILNWTAMRRNRDDQWLVFGPWGHSMSQRGRRGDVTYGEQSSIDLASMIADWFDAWLMEGEYTEPRAKVFVTGRNEWMALDDWPSRESKVVTYHLAPASISDGVGVLTLEPEEEEHAVRYVYDAAQPRDLGFRQSVFADTTRLPFPLEAEDVLFFQTPPLSEPRAVVASIELHLSFSTTVEDTDFFALLVDVDPDGGVRALTHPGKIRARYLDGWSQPRALVPGRAYTAQIRLWDIAHEFAAGHRIGLVVRSDWFPRWSRNLNTIEAISTADTPKRAEQTIRCGGEGASVLRLRVLSDR